MGALQHSVITTDKAKGSISMHKNLPLILVILPHTQSVPLALKPVQTEVAKNDCEN